MLSPHTKQRPLTGQQLVAFLQSISDDFSPSLDSRIDFEQYAAKVLRQAVVLSVWNEDELLGLAVIYCNDVENNIAYLSLLGVSKAARRRGLGRRLFVDAVAYARAQGMRMMRFQTWEDNPAIKLYQEEGFRMVGSSLDRPGGIVSVHMEAEL